MADQTVLRRALTELAGQAASADLRSRVAAGRARRHRRLLTAVAVAVVLLLLTAVGVTRVRDTDAAPPAEKRRPAIIELASAPAGQVKHPRLVVFAGDGSSRSWAIGADGRAVINNAKYVKFAGGQMPRLTADGATVVQVSELILPGNKVASQIHLMTFDKPERTLVHDLLGAPVPRYATLSRDGGTVAVFAPPVPAAGFRGGVQLVDPLYGRLFDVPVPASFSSFFMNGEFSSDGRQVAVVSLAGGVVGLVDVMSGKLTTVRRFAGAAGTSREEGGFAVSPDAHRVVAAINPGGPWVMVSLRTNNVGEPFERPGGERLLTWTDDGHLIFGEYDASTQIYTVRATTLRGTGARLLYRIRLGWDPRNQPVLVARDILVNR